MKLSRLIDYFKEPQPMKAARPLHCVFYSHIWTVYSLQELGLLDPETDVILELATESNFSLALNPFNKYHENILGLLQPTLHLDDLGARFKDIAAPMVLAPHQPASLNALLGAIALAITDASPIENAVVLIHINDAAKFASAYAYMSRFSIVWDIADYPNAGLPALAQVLATEQCLDEQRWHGIHLCNHKQRQLPDSAEREAALRELFDQFPAAKTV